MSENGSQQILADLYAAYDGNWHRCFREASEFWKLQEIPKPFEQPEMLGCPWCGVVPEIRKMPLISPDTYDVTCRNRQCPRRIISAKTPQECADRWNTRVETRLTQT